MSREVTYQKRAVFSCEHNCYCRHCYCRLTTWAMSLRCAKNKIKQLTQNKNTAKIEICKNEFSRKERCRQKNVFVTGLNAVFNLLHPSMNPSAKSLPIITTLIKYNSLRVDWGPHLIITFQLQNCIWAPAAEMHVDMANWSNYA